MLRTGESNNIIIRLAKRNKYTIYAIMRMMRTSETTFRKKLSRPSLFTLDEVMKLSGLLGVKTEVLTYLLIHGQQSAGANEKERSKAYWYISEEIKEEANKLLK